MAPLTTPEKILLWTLRKAEDVGYGGTMVKWYNDAVQKGRKEPFTEKDFTPENLSLLEKYVRDKAAKTGKNSGSITYNDYPYGKGKEKEGQYDDISLTLGQFKWKIDEDGTIHIDDQYNFNLGTVPDRTDRMSEEISQLFFNQYDMANDIGAKVLGETGYGDKDLGTPIKIRIKKKNGS